MIDTSLKQLKSPKGEFLSQTPFHAGYFAAGVIREYERIIAKLKKHSRSWVKKVRFFGAELHDLKNWENAQIQWINQRLIHLLHPGAQVLMLVLMDCLYVTWGIDDHTMILVLMTALRLYDWVNAWKGLKWWHNDDECEFMNDSTPIRHLIYASDYVNIVLSQTHRTFGDYYLVTTPMREYLLHKELGDNFPAKLWALLEALYKLGPAAATSGENIGRHTQFYQAMTLCLGDIETMSDMEGYERIIRHEQERHGSSNAWDIVQSHFCSRKYWIDVDQYDKVEKEREELEKEREESLKAQKQKKKQDSPPPPAGRRRHRRSRMKPRRNSASTISPSIVSILTENMQEKKEYDDCNQAHTQDDDSGENYDDWKEEHKENDGASDDVSSLITTSTVNNTRQILQQKQRKQRQQRAASPTTTTASSVTSMQTMTTRALSSTTSSYAVIELGDDTNSDISGSGWSNMDMCSLHPVGGLTGMVNMSIFSSFDENKDDDETRSLAPGYNTNIFVQEVSKHKRQPLFSVACSQNNASALSDWGGSTAVGVTEAMGEIDVKSNDANAGVTIKASVDDTNMVTVFSSFGEPRLAEDVEIALNFQGIHKPLLEKPDWAQHCKGVNTELNAMYGQKLFYKLYQDQFNYTPTAQFSNNRMLLCEDKFVAGTDANGHFHSNKGIHYKREHALSLLVNKGEIWELALSALCNHSRNDFCRVLREANKKVDNLVDSSWPLIKNMQYQLWRYLVVEIMALANIKFRNIATNFGDSFVANRNSDFIDLQRWQQAPMRGLMCQIYLLQQYNVSYLFVLMAF